jgi:hypothetical protein
MGNCAGRRDGKVSSNTKYTRRVIEKYREDLSCKYTDLKSEAKEKYEDAKFQYRIKKSKSTATLVPDYSLSLTFSRGLSTKFQDVLMKFEKEFPLT